MSLIGFPITPALRMALRPTTCTRATVDSLGRAPGAQAGQDLSPEAPGSEETPPTVAYIRGRGLGKLREPLGAEARKHPGLEGWRQSIRPVKMTATGHI